MLVESNAAQAIVRVPTCQAWPLRWSMARRPHPHLWRSRPGAQVGRHAGSPRAPMTEVSLVNVNIYTYFGMAHRISAGHTAPFIALRSSCQSSRCDTQGAGRCVVIQHSVQGVDTHRGGRHSAPRARDGLRHNAGRCTHARMRRSWGRWGCALRRARARHDRSGLAACVVAPINSAVLPLRRPRAHAGAQPFQTDCSTRDVARGHTGRDPSIKSSAA
jgi:hypothetical protein